MEVRQNPLVLADNKSKKDALHLTFQKHPGKN